MRGMEMATRGQRQRLYLRAARSRPRFLSGRISRCFIGLVRARWYERMVIFLAPYFEDAGAVDGSVLGLGWTIRVRGVE